MPKTSKRPKTPDKPMSPDKPKSPDKPISAYRGDDSPWIHAFNVFLHLAYLLCYRLGVRTEQCAAAVWHAVTRFFSVTLTRWILETARAGARWIARQTRRVLRGLAAPFVAMDRAVRNIRRHTKPAFRRGFGDGVATVFASVCYFFVQVFKAVRWLLNWAAPAAAIYFLVLTVGYYGDVEYALALKYDGYSIGYVNDLSVYDDAESMLLQRLDSIELAREDVRLGQASYSVVFVPDSQLTSTSTLVDQMIQMVTSDLTTAYGVYIDGIYYGAVEDGEKLSQYLDRRLNAAVAAVTMNPTADTEASSIKLSDGVEITGEIKAEFLRDIEIVKGYYPVTGIEDDAPLYMKLDSIVDGAQTYTVEEGDSPWGIMLKTGVTSLSELYAMNPWMEDGELYPGDEVVVSGEVPFLETQLLTEITYVEPVMQEIERVESSSHYVGWASVTDEGEAGEKQIVAEIVLRNGIEVSQTVLRETVTKEPVAGEMLVGTKATGYATYSTGSTTATTASGSFMWPVSGGYASCLYGGYAGHYGQDIAAPRGTNIYASDGGLVEVALYNGGWNGGYGNYVVINHGNGIKTLYAHCSAVYVSAGTYVEKGDVIAAVGMTGNASGNHCHFEIIIQGRKVNPANYIGTSAW